MNNDIYGHESISLYESELGLLCEDCYTKELKRKEQEMIDAQIDEMIEFSYESRQEMYLAR